MNAKRPIGAIHVLAFLAMCLVWGSTWMAIKILVREVPPLHAAAIRTVIAGTLLVGIAWVRRFPFPANADDWEHIIVLGLTMMALPYGLLFWAGQFANSSVIALIYSAMPLVVALLTPLILAGKVPRRDVYSLALGMGGLVLLFSSTLSGSRSVLFGGLAALASVFCSAFSAVYAKRHIHRLHPISNTGLQLLVGSVWLLAATLILERGKPAHWSVNSVLALGFLATFGSAVAFTIYYWLLSSMKPYKLATSSLITPLVAMVEGALLLGEQIPAMMLLAGAIVLAAVANVLLRTTEVPEIAALDLKEGGG